MKVVSFKAQSLYQREKILCYTVNRRLGMGPRDGMDVSGKRSVLPLPGIEQRLFGSPSRVLAIVPAELSWLRGV